MDEFLIKLLLPLEQITNYHETTNTTTTLLPTLHNQALKKIVQFG